MANTIRIKRRTTGAVGAPSSLENAELAFNEVGVVLYYGSGTGGAGGSATEVIAIGGSGAFCDLSSNQTISGTKTFSNPINADVTGAAGTADALTTGRDISVTGDATGSTAVPFDGSANADIALTLATVNADIGTFTKVTVNAKGLVTAASSATLDDIGSPTTAFSFNSQNLTNLADPANAQDAATKQYVDNVAQGLDAKQSVVATTTGNITLSGAQIIDGISVVAGDRVLVKNQTASEENGIYVVSNSAWSRSSDADTWAKLVSAFVFVEEGTTEADTSWVCTVNKGGTLGTTPVTWVQFGSAASYTAGTGLTLSGNEFSITNTLPVAGDGTFGSSSKTITQTVNLQGQVTAINEQDIAITLSQVTDAGTMAAQDSNNVNITGGSITNLTTFDGITIDGGSF